MFGYYNLVVDMTAIPRMKSFGYPVLIDATHSVQMPNHSDGVTHGQRNYVPTIALAGISAGADGIFVEVHPNPQSALSDAETQWPLNNTFELLRKIKNLYSLVNNFRYEKYWFSFVFFVCPLFNVFFRLYLQLNLVLWLIVLKSLLDRVTMSNITIIHKC